MADTIREPIQSRSIEKKNRIIEAGYTLFAKNGYFSTNTAEIAKQAGVSTGIVYGYFHDKRDILIDVLDIYIAKVFEPVLSMFDKLSAPLDIGFIIPKILDDTVKTHKQHAAIHEALHSLSYTDELVNSKFLMLEEKLTVKIADKLTHLGYNSGALYEKVHLAIETVQSYAHECVYDKHPYIDYTVMRQQIIKMLCSLFD